MRAVRPWGSSTTSFPSMMSSSSVCSRPNSGGSRYSPDLRARPRGCLITQMLTQGLLLGKWLITGCVSCSKCPLHMLAFWATRCVANRMVWGPGYWDARRK